MIYDDVPGDVTLVPDPAVHGQIIHLSGDSAAAFIRAVESDEPPNQALLDAAARYRAMRERSTDRLIRSRTLRPPLNWKRGER